MYFAFSKLMLLFNSEILIRCQECGALSFLHFKEFFSLLGDLQGVGGGTNEKCLHTGNFFKIVSML